MMRYREYTSNQVSKIFIKLYGKEWKNHSKITHLMARVPPSGFETFRGRPKFTFNDMQKMAIVAELAYEGIRGQAVDKMLERFDADAGTTDYVGKGDVVFVRVWNVIIESKLLETIEQLENKGEI